PVRLPLPSTARPSPYTTLFRSEKRIGTERCEQQKPAAREYPRRFAEYPVRPAPREQHISQNQIGLANRERQALGVGRDYVNCRALTRLGEHREARVDREHARFGVALAKPFGPVPEARAEIDDDPRRHADEVEPLEQAVSGLVAHDGSPRERRRGAVERAARRGRVRQRGLRAKEAHVATALRDSSRTGALSRTSPRRANNASSSAVLGFAVVKSFSP